MNYTSDHDGKSKTASAVDQKHYPEQNEVQHESMATLPTHDQISQRAREIWKARGDQEGSAEQDWLQAEGELMAATRQGGSVQR